MKSTVTIGLLLILCSGMLDARDRRRFESSGKPTPSFRYTRGSQDTRGAQAKQAPGSETPPSSGAVVGPQQRLGNRFKRDTLKASVEKRPEGVVSAQVSPTSHPKELIKTPFKGGSFDKGSFKEGSFRERGRYRSRRGGWRKGRNEGFFRGRRGLSHREKLRGGQLSLRNSLRLDRYRTHDTLVKQRRFLHTDYGDSHIRWYRLYRYNWPLFISTFPFAYYAVYSEYPPIYYDYYDTYGSFPEKSSEYEKVVTGKFHSYEESIDSCMAECGIACIKDCQEQSGKPLEECQEECEPLCGDSCE